MAVPGLFADLSWRGLIHQCTDPALAGLLDAGIVTGYVGFDPTSDSLTLGNLLGIVALMRLQGAGHRPIALAGGATGAVGDPSGKADERPMLAPDALVANLESIRGQLGRFLDLGPGAGMVLDNREWLGSVGLISFLRDVGKHFSVNAMISKESVRARLAEREQGISFTEFSYLLLQAYDFSYLFDAYGCCLQLGGSDQWGNITAGIDLIRRTRGSAAYGLTFPLVTRADGTKFGKSEGTNVWLDAARTSPYAMYQFLLRSEDAVVGSYLRFYSFRSREDLEALDACTASHPGRREAQRALAHDVVALVHGHEEAVRAERASAALFTEDIGHLDEATLLAVVAEVASSDVGRDELRGGGLALVDLLVRSGLEASRGAARRTIEQRGAYVNNRQVAAVDAVLGEDQLLHGRYAILRKGKATQHVIRVR